MSDLLSDDILGHRCRFKAAHGHEFIYTVKAMWVESSGKLYCALMTDKGQTNAGYFSELDFEPKPETVKEFKHHTSCRCLICEPRG